MRRVRGEDAHEDEADESSRPRKQRKQRPCYSCSGKSANRTVFAMGEGVPPAS